MKYFTPELYVRGQALDDIDVLNQVQQTWEDNVDRYQDHLHQIRPALPAGLVYLLDNFFLHDADVLTLGQNGDTFLFVLQLDPAYASLVLSYRLVQEALINREALPLEQRSSHVEWLYDELELAATEPQTLVHNILLSNGWEVELRFRDVQVTAVHPLLLSDSAERRLDSALKIAGPSAIPPQGAAWYAG